MEVRGCVQITGLAMGGEIYQPYPGLMEGWQSPPTSDYRGIHGLDRP